MSFVNRAKKEDGNAAIMFVVLLPVVLFAMTFFQTYMEARYVRVQTQQILDIATIGATTSGKIYQINGSRPFCVIPFDESGEENGNEIAADLIRKNSQTLPAGARDALLNQLSSGRINGLNDSDEYASGYARAQVEYTYRPEKAVLFQTITIRASSSARCQPESNG